MLFGMVRIPRLRVGRARTFSSGSVTMPGTRSPATATHTRSPIWNFMAGSPSLASANALVGLDPLPGLQGRQNVRRDRLARPWLEGTGLPELLVQLAHRALARNRVQRGLAVVRAGLGEQG